MVGLEHVSKSYAGLRALDDVTLDVPPRAVTVLAGADGAGKSTLLRIVVEIGRASCRERVYVTV